MHPRFLHPTTVVCLDLEKVLIDSWYDVTLCPNNRNLLEEYGVTGGFPVEIFSFAVDNLRDSTFFHKAWKESLEKCFNIKIVEVMTVHELMDIHERVTGCSISMLKYKMRGKTEGFLEYVKYLESLKETQEPVSYILFDDLVDNQDVIFDNYAVHFIRVG